MKLTKPVVAASVFITTFTLTACVDKSYERGSNVDNQGDEVLIGSVSTSDRTALPKHGSIVVLLVEDSENIIARQEIDVDGRPVPIGYRLRYDADDIHDDRRYYIEAVVESHDDTKWKSDRTPVLTQGGLENNVPLVMSPTP